MHKILFLFLLTFFNIVLAEEDKWTIHPTIDKSQKSGVYIPKDINDSFKELDAMLSKELKDEMKENSLQDMSQYHFGLGVWMRNNWGLRSGSRFSKWFEMKGILNPDDMSGIILKSYYQYLTNQPITLNEQIEFYIRYWEIRKKPTNYPCEESEYLYGLNYSKNGKDFYYHIIECKVTHQHFVYELDSGWTEPTPKIMHKIKELQCSGQNCVRVIEDTLF